jgi:hypothetical protein
VPADGRVLPVQGYVQVDLPVHHLPSPGIRMRQVREVWTTGATQVHEKGDLADDINLALE